MEQNLSRIPRRLRRFYRNKESAQASEQPISQDNDFRKQAAEKAKHEINVFRKRFKRKPKQKDYKKIAERLFDKLKKEARQKVLEERKVERKQRREEGEEENEKEEKESKAGRKSREQEGKAGRSEKTRGKGAEKEAGKKGQKEMVKKQGAGAMSVPDLTGMDFSDEASSINLDEIRDDESILKETETKDNTCPTCKNKSDNIIFCPKCGSAFCNHCAKKAKRLEEGKIMYQCPKCGNEFKARKP